MYVYSIPIYSPPFSLEKKEVEKTLTRKTISQWNSLDGWGFTTKIPCQKGKKFFKEIKKIEVNNIELNCFVFKRERPEREREERETREREERDAQSLQGMSLKFHFQFKNALISKGIISNRQAERTESSFHTLFW